MGSIAIITSILIASGSSILITNAIVNKSSPKDNDIEGIKEILDQPMLDYEPTSYTTPIEVKNSINKQKDKLVVYGNKTYIMRPDKLLERDGYIWRTVKVTTTAYTWKDDGWNPRIGAGDGKTSKLKDAKRTYGIAADPKIFPYGTVFHVAGYGEFEVDDTGGAMKGKRKLDLRIPNLRYDGKWRSNSEIRKIAIRHGCQRNRIVLIRVKKKIIRKKDMICYN